MKMKQLSLALALIALAVAAPAAPAQRIPTGPGPAIAGSATSNQLPEQARKFLEKHYRNVAVTKIEREFAAGTYEVDLADGTDIEFDSTGKVKEIDSSDRGPALSKDVVKAVLPHKAYKRIEAAGQAANVDEIDYERGVYTIKTRSVKRQKYGYDVTADTWMMY